MVTSCVPGGGASSVVCSTCAGLVRRGVGGGDVGVAGSVHGTTGSALGAGAVAAAGPAAAVVRGAVFVGGVVGGSAADWLLPIL
jgi:hypothetical protein